jgi:hypothetical protein
MAEEPLDGADVGAALQEMGGKGVAEGVVGNALVEAGVTGSLLDRALHDDFVEVMAACRPVGSLYFAALPIAPSTRKTIRAAHASRPIVYV